MAVTMSKTQMAQAAGMEYDVAADQYVMPDGTRIDAFDVAQGRIGYGQLTGPTGPAPTQQYYSNTTTIMNPSNGWASAGVDMSSMVNTNGVYQSGSLKFPRTVTIKTTKGEITLDLNTGDITFPLEVGRNEAIRDFWMGFQQHFKAGEVQEYEKRIADLKHNIAVHRNELNQRVAETSILKSEIADLKKKASAGDSKAIAQAIANKYAGRDLLMIKTADLVREIEKL